MKVAVFSAKRYDVEFLTAANDGRHELVFLEPRLTAETAALAEGARAVCAFVNDKIDAAALQTLREVGCEFIALRCAGFNNVDMSVAHELGIAVARVPAYSPFAVAEHAVGLMLTLNRKFHRAYNRVREGNFALDGLLGFDMHGKTVGIIGSGRIGICLIRILLGFGCRVLVHDPQPSDELRALSIELVELKELLQQSDVVSLHCPLTPQTHYLLNEQSFAQLKRGAMVINTSRGALIDSRAAVEALKSGQLGALGLDVYEEEEAVFYEDRSGTLIDDDVLLRLLAFPNVLITGHQAFFTREALENIARTTIENLNDFETSGASANAV